MAKSLVRARWGQVQRWLNEVAIPFKSEECLIFPFSRNEDGYGTVREGGKIIKAHTFVAKRILGPKPGTAYECLHGCGNGHLGCVNGAHLRWGSHAENMADAVAHGTTRNKPRYGADHHDFRATDEVIEAMLADLYSGMTQKAVGKKYGFGQSHVSRIKSGWRRSGQ